MRKLQAGKLSLVVLERVGFFYFKERPARSLVLTDSRWACSSTKVSSVFGMGRTKRAPSTSCAARQLYSPNQKQPLPRGLASSHPGCLCARFCEPPSSPARLSPHRFLSDLFSVCFLFSNLFSEYIWGHTYSSWGGAVGRRGRGKGRKEEEGGRREDRPN